MSRLEDDSRNELFKGGLKPYNMLGGNTQLKGSSRMKDRLLLFYKQKVQPYLD